MIPYSELAETARLHSKVLSGPTFLSFDITNRCNLRCLHCYNRSGENLHMENEMTDNEVLDFLEDITIIKPYMFCFCGGEPLLRKKLLLKGIEKLHEQGVQVNVVTNGLLITEEVVQELKQAGVNFVQVSLDGATAFSHDKLRGLEGAFGKSMDALKLLKSAGITTGVSFCPTRWNIAEFEDLYKIVEELGVSELRTQCLMDIGRGSENIEVISPSEQQYRDLVRTIRRIKNLQGTSTPSIEWGDPIDHLIRYNSIMENCCSFAFVRADGYIVPSIYIPMSVGNVKKHKFSEYWSHGMARVWKLKIMKEIAGNIKSINDMNFLSQDNMPIPFKEKDLDYDFIDDKLYLEVSES